VIKQRAKLRVRNGLMAMDAQCGVMFTGPNSHPIEVWSSRSRSGDCREASSSAHVNDRMRRCLLPVDCETDPKDRLQLGFNPGFFSASTLPLPFYELAVFGQCRLRLEP
jgi:hypothetical protein